MACADLATVVADRGAAELLLQAKGIPMSDDDPYRTAIAESELLGQLRTLGAGIGSLREVVARQASATARLTEFLMTPAEEEHREIPTNPLTVQTTARPDSGSRGFTTVDTIHLHYSELEVLRLGILPPDDAPVGSFFQIFREGRRLLAGLTRAYREPQMVCLPIIDIGRSVEIETTTPGFVFYLWGGPPVLARPSGPGRDGQGRLYDSLRDGRRRDPFGGPYV